MTRNDIVNFVCSKVGQVDDHSKELCAVYVQTRYKMIWDAESWRDTQRVQPAVANGLSVPFPPDVERIISVRCSGTFLDPVDTTYIFESEPALFDATGTPRFYEDFTDPETSVRSLRLYPHPNSQTALLISGKRPCPVLAATDTPQLRNVDNALIAFTMGDMLERARQYAKAQAKFTEAGAHLDSMRKLETEQANRQRAVKALGTGGNTLGGLADEVAARIGDYSPTAYISIKQHLRREYQAIWDSFLWRQSMVRFGLNVQYGLAALPAGVERVVSVRFGGNAIEPVDTALQFDVDAMAFDTGGDPLSFTESADVNGMLQIEFHPTPPDGSAVLVLGKLACPVLAADGDTARLRNVGNALVNLAAAGMKMDDAMRAVGMAHVAAMQKLEADQSMRVRQTRALTVSGDSLGEMTDAVLARCGVYDIENAILAREFLRRQYRSLWDSRSWKESNVLSSVACDGSTIVLPYYIERVIALRGPGAMRLLPAGMDHLFNVAPGIFDGQPFEALGFSILTSIGVRVRPANEAMSFVSTDPGDTGSVFIRGESAGLEVCETLSLQGTTPVRPATVYDTPLTVAKPITRGTVTITGTVTGNVLLTLPPNERERKHIRLFLLGGAGGQMVNCLVLGKRKIQPLVTNEDTPMLRQASDALIHAAVGDLAMHLGKTDLAAGARAQAAAAVQTLIDLENNQGANIMQLTPYVEPTYGCVSGGDYWNY